MICPDLAKNRSAPRAFARASISFAAVGLALLLIRPAPADDVIAGQQPWRRVELTGYGRGAIEFRTLSGETLHLPIEQLDSLFIDTASNMDDFNQAEEYLRQQQPGQAVIRYERVLVGLRGFWADLALARLCTAADRAGQFERSVRAFLQLAERDAVSAAAILPRSLAPPTPQDLDQALRRIDQAAQRDPAAEFAPLIPMLRFALLTGAKDARAGLLAEEIAAQQFPTSLCKPRSAGVRLTAIEAVLAAGKPSAAAAAADKLLESIPEAMLPDVLMVKSRALLAAAQSPDECLASTLPALRIVIHYPDHELTGPALLLAATAHERSGRRADAVRLLRDILRRDRLPDAVKSEARARLEALRDTNP